MGYNIDTTEIIEGSLSIRVGDFRRLAKELEDQLPECSFLNEGKAPEANMANEKLYPLKILWWNGGNSESEKLFADKVAPFLVGEADVLLTWEGGDCHSGWRIKDGKVTQCSVKMALVPEVAG